MDVLPSFISGLMYVYTGADKGFSGRERGRIFDASEKNLGFGQFARERRGKFSGPPGPSLKKTLRGQG